MLSRELKNIGTPKKGTMKKGTRAATKSVKNQEILALIEGTELSLKQIQQQVSNIRARGILKNIKKSLEVIEALYNKDIL